MAITLPGTGSDVETRTGAGGDERQVIALGSKAVAHGSNPSAVAAGVEADLPVNRHGVPFIIGGHPNIISRSHTVTDSDGPQTNTALLSVSTGTKIVVTQISAVCDANNTTNIAVRIGFHTTTVPAASLSGTNGLLIDGIFGAGSGQQKGDGGGIIGIGADAEDLLLTCGDPVSGNVFIQYSYFTIES
jgi:hypothetical protein